MKSEGGLQLLDDVGLLRADGMAYVRGAGQKVTEARMRGVVAGLVAVGLGEGWLLGSGTNYASLGLSHNRVAATANYDPLTGQTLRVTSRRRRASPLPTSSPPSEFQDQAGGLTELSGRSRPFTLRAGRSLSDDALDGADDVFRRCGTRICT